MSDTARLEALEARIVHLEEEVRSQRDELERIRTALALMGHLADGYVGKAGG